MPGKGHALDKWIVNGVHKAEEQKLARSAAAAAAASPPADELEVDLRAIIDGSQLSADRKDSAKKDMQFILVQFRAGKDPFAALRPHCRCAVCPGGLSKDGNPKKSHPFFCQSRRQKPPSVEQLVRAKFFLRLRAAWSARQHELQVRVSFRPPVRPSHPSCSNETVHSNVQA
jgi:hypothetical protein